VCCVVRVAKDARVRLVLQAQNLDTWDCGAVALPIKLGADVGGWELVTGIGAKRTAQPKAEEDWVRTTKRAEGTDQYSTRRCGLATNACDVVRQLLPHHY